MKNRLITFGCSYTYGQGLPDCQSTKILKFTFDSAKSSKLGWAQQVADELGLELVNKGIPGASNLEILHSILEFDFRDTDTVVIMWSHILRDIVITRLFNLIPVKRRLGTWKKSNLSMKWIEYLSEEDYAMRTWVYMHHAGLYLKTSNIKYIHYPATMTELNNFTIPKIKIDNLYTSGIIRLDQCENGDIHPGLKSNTATAAVISEILKQVL